MAKSSKTEQKEKRDKEARLREKKPLYIGARFVGAIIRIFMGYTCKGTHHIDELSGGAVMICNHVRWCDPFIIINFLKRRINFMAKRELFDKKVFAFCLTRVGSFPVERHTSDLTSIHIAIDIVQKGGICVLFPEGTRSITGDPLPFEEGAAFIAMRCNCPVVPSYITPPQKRGSRVFIVGKPLSVEELQGDAPKEERRHAVTMGMSAAVEMLRASSPQAGYAPLPVSGAK